MSSVVSISTTMVGKITQIKVLVSWAIVIVAPFPVGASRRVDGGFMMTAMIAMATMAVMALAWLVITFRSERRDPVSSRRSDRSRRLPTVSRGDWNCCRHQGLGLIQHGGCVAWCSRLQNHVQECDRGNGVLLWGAKHVGAIEVLLSNQLGCPAACRQSPMSLFFFCFHALLLLTLQSCPLLCLALLLQSDTLPFLSSFASLTLFLRVTP